MIIFSDVCQAFHKYTKLNKSQSMTKIASTLLDFFTLNGNILNGKGEEYFINPKEYIEFFKGEKDIYTNIKVGVESYNIIENIEENICVVFDDLVYADNHKKVAEYLLNLLQNDEVIDNNLKSEIMSLDINDPYTIVAKIFIYSMKNNNKREEATKKISNKSVDNTIKTIRKLFSQLPKKLVLEIPKDATEQELNYVVEILDAISERTGVLLSGPSDLRSNPKLKKYSELFDRDRKDYYAAESVRESLKDTNLFNGEDEFRNLKDEAKDAVADLFFEDYKDSFECMTKVLNHITKVDLRSLIATIPGWVNVSEKKGLCHMLVNEKEITWKNE